MSMKHTFEEKMKETQKSVEGLLDAISALEHPAKELPNKIDALRKQHMILDNELKEKQAKSADITHNTQKKADSILESANKSVSDAAKAKAEADDKLIKAGKLVKELEDKHILLDRRLVELDKKEQLLNEKLGKIEAALK